MLDLISLSDAAELLPKRPGGKPISRRALQSWALVGVNGVKLETWCVGRLRCTTVEALDRFIARCSGVMDDQPQARTPKQRQKASDLADRELEEMGA